MNHQLLTIGEAAKLLKKSISTLRRWDQGGKLSSFRASRLGYRRYRKNDLIRFLEGPDFILREPINSFIFDFDSTLIREESMCTILKRIVEGRSDGKRIQTILDDCTRQAMNGDIPLCYAIKQRLSLVQPHKKDFESYGKMIISKITSGMKEIVQFLHDYHQRVFIMSGGMKDYIFPVADFLHISRENVFGNRIFFDEQGKFSHLDMKNPLVSTQGKTGLIRELKESGMLPGSIVLIGDGMSDYHPYQEKEADMFLGFGQWAKHLRVKQYAPYYFGNSRKLFQFLRTLF